MEAEHLLLALTRPTMFWGVPAEAAFTNLLVSFYAGALLSDHTIWRNPFMFWAAGVPVHMAMRRMISRDYHAFRTVWLWVVTFGHNTLESLPTQRPASGRKCASSV